MTKHTQVDQNREDEGRKDTTTLRQQPTLESILISSKVSATAVDMNILYPKLEALCQEIAREARLDELLTVCEESVFDYQYKPDVWTKGAACMSKQWLDERIAELTQKPAGGGSDE